MSQEKLKILEMLKENTITTEEALKLLEQISKQDAAQDYGFNDFRHHSNDPMDDDGYEVIGRHLHNTFGSAPRGPRPRRMPRGGRRGNVNSQFNVDVDMDWVDDLRENVEESVKNFSDYIYQNYTPFDHMKPNSEVSFISEDIMQDISSLKLYGKNSSCEIIGHGGKNIEIQAFYRTKGPANPQIQFEEENGDYALYYDTNVISSMKLKVRVPDVRVNDLYVENKNSHIKIEDLTAKNITAITKSAHIKLEDITADSIMAETKNGALYLDNITSQILNLKTVNAKIDLDRVNAKNANLITYNAAIRTKNCNIENVTAKTKNGAIKLDNFRDIEKITAPASVIEAVTTNSGILIEVPKEDIPGISVKAATSFGNIDTDLKNLVINTINKSDMDAATVNYEESQNKIDLFLNTSNGKISVKRR